MGDMKTPDFDDLLAAFDIPDIESIQSSPEEDNVAVNENDGPHCSPAPFRNDPPAVSVIVKNTAESSENEQTIVKDDSRSSVLSNSDLKPDTYLRLDNVDSPTDAKLHGANTEAPFAANGFKGSSSDQGQSEHLPFKSFLDNSDGDCKQVDQSPQHTTDVINHFKHHLYPKPSADFIPISPDNPSPSPASPQPSPHSPKREAAGLPDDFPSAAATDNSSAKAVRKDAAHYEDDDSEPDFGSPLVIQESPEFEMASPKKWRQRRRLSSELCASPENVSSVSQPSKMSPPGEDKLSTPSLASPAPPPHSPLNTVSSVNEVSALIQTDKYPEHVIDERDSPESPPPSETGKIPPRSTSPEVAATADLSMDNMSPNHPDKPTDCKPDDVETCSASREMTKDMAEQSEVHKKDGATESKETTPASSASSETAHVLPLKVKIKVPTSCLTKSGAGASSKKTGRNTPKAAGGSKPSDDSRLRSELTSHLSPAVIQDGVTQNGHNTSLLTKPPVSSTAVIITKSAALPTISCRVNPSAISLGQKPLNDGTTARPASIVNTTGATISKSQTSLVESFNKILNTKNLLPCYKPDLTSPPAEWGLPLPAQGYRCLECGDAFALEQSLTRHYDRRSLRIEVTCNHCAKRLAFFNKCSLLLHAREHKERGLVMQCSHLVMKPVPVEQMISPHGPAAKGQSAPNTIKTLHTVPTKASESLQYVDNKCPECQTQFSSREEVVQHFQEVQPSHNTPCVECSPPMLLPNSCSAAAHLRVHQQGPPCVCPECGGTAKQEAFQKHLDETCLHFARRIGYRCSSCLVVFGGMNSVKSHIQQAHCDTFHKCPSCPMAFKSAPSTQSHIAAQHPTLTGAQAMLIYKCVMCDTVFTQTSLLNIHFETHLTNQQVHVFKCPECTKLFSQRSSLIDHFKTHKSATLDPGPSASPAQQPVISSTEEELMDQDAEEVKAEIVKAPSGWKCAPCHSRFSDRQEFIDHMAKEHSKILKKFPCTKCDSSFTTTSSMRRHIRDKHKVVNRVFSCQFCTEGKKTFSSRALLDRHVQLRHSGETQDGRVSADGSSAKSVGLRARRRRRRDVKLDQVEESPDTVSPVKKLRASSSQPESGFRCAPCGFTTEDQPAFLEHIGQHLQAAPEASSQQCLQCGACFTSTSSLARHQFITHKVKDAPGDQITRGRVAASLVNRNVDEQSSQGESAPASPSSQMKGDEGTHACKVCRKRFEKASDLNTHFRTHGMAFISARNCVKST